MAAINAAALSMAQSSGTQSFSGNISGGYAFVRDAPGIAVR
jgi:hypothetical protein